MTPEEAERALGATLAKLGIAETALLGTSHTIARAPESAGAGAPLPKISFDLMARTSPAAAESAAGGADLVARGELGRGGMGVVHLAQQRSLHRDVAVKTTFSHDAGAALALVREARIMGSLEHPNLVPVHALGIDGAGAPVLVMKRIEGVAWRVLLADPAHEAWRPLLAGHEDPLRANVEILSQVARALAFAHDRGVIHRDIKPDNVMIGRFGEVYLVDWGVALRLSERDREPAAIVGTPAYLAPEMALGDPRHVDARTDVYLLGGTLYEVLTGRMPHDAPTPIAAIVMALTGEVPAIPADVPRELADLAGHAMALAQADRLASAEAFREGLARFLASREVDRAVAEARLALARAREFIAHTGPDSLDAFSALIEARTTLVSAHRTRPRDTAIRADLDASIGHLVERELALRSPVAARTLLAEMGTPTPELVSRVEALERELAAERAAVDAYSEARRAADTSTGLSSYSTIGTMIFGVIAPSFFAWSAWTFEAHGREFPMVWGMGGLGATLLATLLAQFVARRTVFATTALRRNCAFLVILEAALLLTVGVTYALGGTASDAVPQVWVIGAVFWGVWSATDIPDGWPNVIVCLAAVGVTLALPGWVVTLSVPTIVLCWIFAVRGLRLQAQRSGPRRTRS